MDFERDLYRGAAGYYPEMFRQPFYMSYPAGSRFMDEAEYEEESLYEDEAEYDEESEYGDEEEYDGEPEY